MHWSGRSFNPCCGGSGSLGFRSVTRSSSDWISFNPCCGGSGSLGTRAGLHVGPRYPVSILVVVDRARWAIQTANPLRSSIMVSILVVVDRARWGHTRCRRLCRPRGFNPCCGGSGSLGSIHPRPASSRFTRFQSLLWWIGLAGSTGFSPRGGTHEVSILVVVDRARWEAGSDLVLGQLVEVSILVVVDRARWAMRGTLDGPCNIRFQSLLWWIGLAGVWSICRPSVLKRFNPCCGGSGSLGARSGRAWKRPLVFQSLLWWIGLAGTGGGQRGREA